MKKILVLFAFLLVIIFTNLISANCALNVNFVNQDPYPAVPGEYVKLLFQLRGLEESECGDAFFELVEEHPISFDPGFKSRFIGNSGTFAKDFDSYFALPYKVRVDANALEGDVPIKVRYGSVDSKFYLSKEFNLSVKDVKTDFEVFVKDYAPPTLTFEILNIGKSDVESLTLEIPEQENIIMQGASRNIVGSLDSNDFTTSYFTAVPSKGNIYLKIHYTDEINVRRTVDKTASFDPKYFVSNREDKNNNSIFTWIAAVVAITIIFIFYRWHKKRKRKKLLK